ncbi:MAG: hypothetical protein GY953_18870 [bacterium]|nr:hypothetical protein [bacterium]
MPRRHLLLTVSICTLGVLAAAPGTSLRGKLTLGAGGKPAIETAKGPVYVTGDADTMGVLTDHRLVGEDLEVIGQQTAPEAFRVGPIHKKSMWLHREGKRYMVTYWCEVCAIRTYTPGICQCCQEETALDPKEEHVHLAR